MEPFTGSVTAAVEQKGEYYRSVPPMAVPQWAIATSHASAFLVFP
jgi:hypothetical protein